MNTTRPAPPVSKEIRFAVVMYGGVSLAIYINGVTQELFKMVRATARAADGSYLIPAPDPDQPSLDSKNVLSPTEMIYREIGEKIQAKFVVDILSGTSAGGINAVYLAKALANDQSLDGLKSIWIQEGDIALLVNDNQSTQGLPRNLARALNQKPRTSLLNSQRMYFKLLEALDKMDAKSPSGPSSPYVDTLDLFVTATDLHGLTSSLRISKQEVQERRYRNVFHFAYSNEDGSQDKAGNWFVRNDFHRTTNPFLAFAARCTSSFPFAFEPMALTDIQDVLNSSAFYNSYRYEPEIWKQFFVQYLRGPHAAMQPSTGNEALLKEAIHHFEERPFGDGGYLDNKPFSFTTRAILERQSTIPVDRKLLYIEPSPEHVEEDGLRKERPDAFANVLSALLTLPRVETIREDLQLLAEHNRVVRRLRGTTELAMRAIFQDEKAMQSWQNAAGRNKKWEKKSLQDMIRDYGDVYGVYHQLRVTQVTDDLATLIAGTLGADEESEVWRKLRGALKQWREARYAPDPEEGKEPENEFLHKFDIGWRIRRLRFLLFLLDRMFITAASNGQSEINAQMIFHYSRAGEYPAMMDQREEYRQSLGSLKQEIHHTLAHLKTGFDQAPVHEFVQMVEKAGNPDQAMANLLEHLHGILRTARVETEAILGRGEQAKPGNPSKAREQIQVCIQHYFDLFEYFDLMTFPIQYGTPLGEVDEVDIWRISPEDATSIIDEKAEKRKKLMGIKFGNFGGFFNKEWRIRDILWGRLDGAERLITALLNGTDCEGDAPALIQRANVAILREELLRNVPQVSPPLAETIWKINSNLKMEKRPIAAASGQNGESFDSIVLKMGPETVRTMLKNSIQEKELVEIFKKSQEVEEALKPETTLNIAARATQVMARLLDDIQLSSSALKKRTVWIYRLGQVISAMVQVALPNSFTSILFRNTIRLVYLAAILILLAGRFVNPALTNTGWQILGITALFHLTVRTLGDYLRGRQTHRFLKWVLAGILISVLLLVVFVGLTHFNEDILIPFFNFFGWG